MAELEKILNIPRNAVLPYNPLRQHLLLGGAEYIAIEAVVSKVFRLLLNLPRKSWVELLGVHAISLSYLGGASAYAGEVEDLESDYWVFQVRLRYSASIPQRK